MQLGAEEEGGVLRRRTRLYILGRLSLLATILVLYAWVEWETPGPVDGGFYQVAGLIFLLTAVSAAALPVMGHLRAFAVLQVVIDTVVIVSLVLSEGGRTDSTFIFLLFLAVLGANYLVGGRGAVVLALVQVGVLGALGLWEIADALSQEEAGGSGLLPIYVNVVPKALGLVLVALLGAVLTEQLRAQGERLQSVEREFAAVVGALRSGLILVDADGRLRTANDAALRMAPEVQDRLVQEVLGAEAVSAAEPWEVTRRHGEDVKRILVTRSPLDGGGAVLTLEDVTALRAMEHQTEREERIGAIAQLAASIAHEVRNPLASLSGAVQLLRALPEDEPLKNIILRETRRLDHLVSRFLDLSRPGSSHFVSTDVVELVRSVAEAFRRDPRYAGTVSVQLATERVPEIEVDGERLRQLLWNLLLNGAQAMPDGGEVTVHLRAAGDKVHLMVVDQGVGIPEEDLERVFDPFFSRRLGGTGLGLATVEKVVREHQGTLRVDSVVGRGTTFHVWLPAVSSDQHVALRAGRSASAE